MLPKIDNILYPTDLSDNSRAAFYYAAALAEKFDAKITVLHVIEKISQESFLQISSYFEKDEWARLKKEREDFVLNDISERLNTFCSEMSENIDSCRFLLDKIITRRGIPVEEILNQAETDDSDLIVMGTHGYNILADALMGGTARRVVRRSKVPVTIIPAALKADL